MPMCADPRCPEAATARAILAEIAANPDRRPEWREDVAQQEAPDLGDPDVAALDRAAEERVSQVWGWMP